MYIDRIASLRGIQMTGLVRSPVFTVGCTTQLKENFESTDPSLQQFKNFLMDLCVRFKILPSDRKKFYKFFKELLKCVNKIKRSDSRIITLDKELLDIILNIIFMKAHANVAYDKAIVDYVKTVNNIYPDLDVHNNIRINLREISSIIRLKFLSHEYS